jgi:hypothetical protein
MTLQKVIDVLELTETGIKVSDNTDSNKQQGVTTIQGIIRMHACHEEILKEKKVSYSGQSSVLYFIKPFSRTRASPPVLLDTGYGGPDDPPCVQNEVSPP